MHLGTSVLSFTSIRKRKHLAGPPILLLFLFVSVSLAEEKKEDEPATAVKVRRAPFRHTVVEEGILVPAHATALRVRPRAYTGKLRVLEVVAHGATVSQGDVVLRLDPEGLETALHKRELALRTKEIGLHRARVALEELERDSDRDREEAEQDVELARHSLDGYREIQRPLDARSYQRGEKTYLDSIADQEDEIDQLGKMYKEDELTEATEELVLKRARRKLASTQERLEIYRARFRYSLAYSENKTLHTLERALEQKEAQLRKLRRAEDTGREQAEIKLAGAKHDLSASRKNLERLREDTEAFALRAPHAGIVLHGNLVSPSPPNGVMDGKVAAKAIRVGDVVTPGSPVITVATAGAMKVRFALKSADRYHAKAGMAAAVLPKALPETVLAATLEPMGRFPRPDGSWTAHALFGGGDERLVPLLKCTVRAVLIDLPDALIVPTKALFQRDGRWYCHARDRSPFGLSARAVVRGATSGKYTVILDGLREGDEILLPEQTE